MRAVVDTNVLVAAAINRTGRPALRLEFISRRGILTLSQATFAEIADVLERRYFAARLDRGTRAAFIVAPGQEAHFVEPTETIHLCRDPKDDKFLEAALAGRADCIVSGDADLLILDPFRGIRIQSPASFLTTAEAARRSGSA